MGCSGGAKPPFFCFRASSVPAKPSKVSGVFAFVAEILRRPARGRSLRFTDDLAFRAAARRGAFPKAFQFQPLASDSAQAFFAADRMSGLAAAGGFSWGGADHQSSRLA
jgi:hypothetical protein